MLLFANINTALAKDYFFSNVNIDIYVNPDGSFDWVENRTFDFSGDFHWAEYKVYKTRAENIVNFQVLENGRQFEADASGSPGTVFITDTNDSVTAKWFYDARDEMRTFTIKYKVIGAITAYSDVAEFYWKIIGAEWDVGTDHILATLHLPSGAG